MIFFGVHVYNLSNVVIRLILAVRTLCGNLLDSIIQRYISHHIVKSLTPSKIANLIELLESMYIFINIVINKLQIYIFNFIDLLFPSEDGSLKTENHQISVEQLINSSIFHSLYKCIFQCTQNAVMNKQLFYRLLDAILEETFPEFQTQLNEQL